MTKKSNINATDRVHADVLRLLNINKKIAKLYRKAGKLEFRNGFVDEAGKNLIKAAELYPQIKKSISFNGDILTIEKNEDNDEDKLFLDHKSDEPSDLTNGILNRLMENARMNAIKNFDFNSFENKKPYTAKDLKFPEYATLFALPFPQDDEDLIEFSIEDALGDIENILGLLNKNDDAKTSKKEPYKNSYLEAFEKWNEIVKKLLEEREKEKAYDIEGWNNLLKILEGNGYNYTNVELPFSNPTKKHAVVPVTADGEKVINAAANNEATKKQKKGIKDVISNSPLEACGNNKTINRDCNKPSAIDHEVIKAMPDRKLSKQLEDYMKAKKIVGTDIVTLEDILNILSGRY